jgi:hypothetical protein
MTPSAINASEKPVTNRRHGTITGLGGAAVSSPLALTGATRDFCSDELERYPR